MDYGLLVIGIALLLVSYLVAKKTTSLPNTRIVAFSRLSFLTSPINCICDYQN
ncbi:hypothetical protein [Peribacillus frigoritolerans]|uniref:hypothetical protein n=1 Tax=Peribacillus frigoritolerans TaxID=450367 RepID=UPI0033061BEC